MTTISQSVRQDVKIRRNDFNQAFADKIDLKRVPVTGATRVVYCQLCGCPVTDRPAAMAEHNDRARHHRVKELKCPSL